MPLPGTIRDERGYTGAEGGQAEDDPLRFYGLEREKKAVPWCLFVPPVVARQRKHVEENILVAGTDLSSFMYCRCILLEGGTIMEVLYRRRCGRDVHKKFLVACLLVVDERGQSHKEIRRFSTMTGDLLACIDWLEQARCTAIAMESTGVYWYAPHNLMEGRFELVMVVNAEHLKRVPGHKTDVKDAGATRSA